ncbi:MAG: sulfatase-like hydrolase/transferase [Oscillospiraceae bacterium]|nr:sulfatase-like hydrolase/transferase [Oscillospiraceae bacterium]
MNNQNDKNLLFIMCDQQRYDCIGFAGIRPVKTPNIDRIAKNGVWFKNAYTPIPVCAPARQSLITGRRPEVFGALWNFHITHLVRELSTEDYAYPRHLKQNGYNTAFCGKWNVSASLAPDKFGFDIYLGDGEINAAINKKYPDIIYENGYFGDPSPIPLEDSHTHILAKKANKIINNFAKQNKPWFINIDFSEPHLPCRPSSPFDAMYKPEEIEIWGSFGDEFKNKPYMHRQQVINWELEDRTWEEWSRTVALYYGCISQYDDAIGRILKNLEDTGQLENTIIVYTCDHGDLCGSHKMLDKHYVMYEDLTHVPFIISCKEIIKPGIFDGYVHNCLDFAPTILDLLNIDKPEGIFHGESLAGALTNGGEYHKRDCAVSSYNGQQFGLYSSRCIKTDDNYKYVWNLSDIDEFYDLNADPHELDNIIYDESKAGLISELRIKLYNELKKCGDPMIEWVKNQLLKGRKI